MADVATTLQVLLGGNKTSTFTRANKQYDVMVQLDPRARATPSDMTGLYVRGRGGELVKLEALASVQEGVGPRELNHFDRVRSATLTASLAPGFTLGEALDSLNRLAKEVLPKGSSTALAGESRELEESGVGALFRLSPGAGRCVHGSGQPVRIADSPVHRAAGRSAGGHRGAVHSQTGGLHPQCVQPDRHDP